MSNDRPSIKTPVGRFLAGAMSLTGTTVAGTLAVTTLANPASLAVLGGIAAFAGGAAVYNGWRADQQTEIVRDIHGWLQQLVKQQVDFAKALANIPRDAPIPHGHVVERLREVSHVLSGDASFVADRLMESGRFAKFISDSRYALAAECDVSQNDFDRLIQMGFDQKTVTEDMAHAMSGLESKLDKVHGAIVQVQQSQQLIHSTIDEMKSASIVLSPQASLLVAKECMEQRDPRIKVNPTATLEGVRYEVASAGEDIEMQVHLFGPRANVEIAHEKLKRGEEIIATELGITLEASSAPGHPDERIAVAEVRFYSSLPVNLRLAYIDAGGKERGDLNSVARLCATLFRQCVRSTSLHWFGEENCP